MREPTYYLSALLAAVCFAIVFRTPRRYLLHTTFVGFCSAAGLTIFPESWHKGIVTFFTALAIGALSHVMARYTRAPAQCFLIPGVILLVPGTYAYRSFSAAIGQDNVTAVALALTAVTITFSISFGLLLANWLVPSRKTL